jgi:hypothetical protein
MSCRPEGIHYSGQEDLQGLRTTDADTASPESEE